MDDAGPYVQAFADDPLLDRKIGMAAPSPATARRMFRGERRQRERGEVARFVISDDSDAFNGLVLLHSFEWTHRRAELGFMVVPAARRRGLALEALRLVVRWAFASPGLQRVGLTTLPDNDATQGLAERAGFRREGVLRSYTREWDEPKDNVVFGAIPEDPAWAA